MIASLSPTMIAVEEDGDGDGDGNGGIKEADMACK